MGRRKGAGKPTDTAGTLVATTRFTKNGTMLPPIRDLGRSNSYALKKALEEIRRRDRAHNYKSMMELVRDKLLTATSIMDAATRQLEAGNLMAAYEELSDVALHESCHPKGDDELWRFCDLALGVSTCCGNPVNFTYLANNWLQHARGVEGGGAAYLRVALRVAGFYQEITAIADCSATLSNAARMIAEHKELQQTPNGIEVQVAWGECFYRQDDMTSAAACLEKAHRLLRDVDTLERVFRVRMLRRMARVFGSMCYYSHQLEDLVAGQTWLAEIMQATCIKAGVVSDEALSATATRALTLPERVALLKLYQSCADLTLPEVTEIRTVCAEFSLDKALALAELHAFEEAEAELQLVFMVPMQAVGARFADIAAKFKERLDKVLTGLSLPNIDTTHNHRRCTTCGQTGDNTLLQCECRRAWYCTKECQHRDWVRHRPRCLNCTYCAKVLKDAAMKLCSRCKTARYCNQQCSTADWLQHKTECVPPVAPAAGVKTQSPYVCYDCAERSATSGDGKEK